VIERHITFNVQPDRTGEFERFFTERYRAAMAQAPGFIRSDLLREAEAPTRYHMTLRFADTESSLAWRTSAVHQALQPDLKSLAPSSELVAYEVVA